MFSQVVLESGKEVVEVKPQIDEIVKLAGRGMIITGAGPPGTEFDFCSRYFCPQFGIDEVIHGTLTFERLEFASRLFLIMLKSATEKDLSSSFYALIDLIRIQHVNDLLNVFRILSVEVLIVH